MYKIIIFICLNLAKGQNIPVIGRPGSSNGKEQYFPTIHNDENYWIFSLHWPQTTCEIINNNKDESCACNLGDPLQRGFSEWKIHGFWPAAVTGSGCGSYETLPDSTLHGYQLPNKFVE